MALLCGCILCLFIATFGAVIAEAEDGTVHIGVLARRGSESAIRNWSPTAEYLSATIKDFQFDIVPLSFEELYPAVQAGKISFIIANPSVYTEMQALYGVSRMATLKALAPGGYSTVFGGVIFCRSERTDLVRLESLKGKSFIAVDEASLGGWQMAWRELKEQGIDPFRDFSRLSFAGTHDQVVYAVMEGKADAGTVAAPILEHMIEERKIVPGAFRVINQVQHDDFPYLHSTKLYPEWPFAKLRNTPDVLAEKVAVALIGMPAGSEAARAANSAGWTVPHDYGTVNECLKVLRIGIYKDYGKLDAASVLRQYKWQIASVVATIFLLAWFLAMALRLNRRLHLSGLALQEEMIHRKEAEEEAGRISEQKDLILSSARDGIFGLNTQGNVTFANPAAGMMVGIDAAELVGRPHHEMVHHTRPDGRAYPREECPIYAALREATAASGAEEVFWRKDGTSFSVEYSSAPLYGQGELQGAVVTFRDITKRKLAENALKESAEINDAIINQASEGIVLVDPQTLRFVQFNDAACHGLGYSREEFAAITLHEIQGIQTGVQVGDLLEKVLETGHARFENRQRLKDGSLRDVLTSVAVLPDRNYLVAVWLDITELKRAEQNLVESKRRLSQIIDFLPDATFVVDKNGQVIAWNRAAEAMTGIGAKDMIGKGNYEYSLPFYGERRPILIDFALHPEWEAGMAYTAFERRGDIVFGEAFTPKLPPGNIHLSATASVLRDADGRIVAAIECIRDNTERRTLEERLQRAEKMEALGTLAGGVAHDLNNVLGAVVGYSELLLSDLDESSPQNSYAAEILKGGQRAAAIVQDLLTLARRGVPSRKVLNLNDVIRDLQGSSELGLLCSYHPDVRILTELDPSLLNVAGSQVHLVKSLFNLVSNAAEAMQDGGTIKVKTSNRYLDKALRGYDEVREGDYVVMTVSDTGVGIAPPDLKRIFEPFYTKKVMGRRSGTGLGLAVVWGTVRDHMGYIDVESTEGKGTAFTIYLPVTREEIAMEQGPVSVVEYAGKGESILVVDDVKAQRELAERMLSRLNYQVSTVPNGEEAVHYLQRHPVDLVVLDMIMDPGMDGLDTYTEILRIRPCQRAIIVSGFSETGRVSQAQALGAGAYVKKPYVLEKLGLAVRRELDRPGSAWPAQ
jgi:PAS domain S-box-containing protein